MHHAWPETGTRRAEITPAIKSWGRRAARVQVINLLFLYLSPPPPPCQLPHAGPFPRVNIASQVDESEVNKGGGNHL